MTGDRRSRIRRIPRTVPRNNVPVGSARALPVSAARSHGSGEIHGRTRACRSITEENPRNNSVNGSGKVSHSKDHMARDSPNEIDAVPEIRRRLGLENLTLRIQHLDRLQSIRPVPVQTVQGNGVRRRVRDVGVDRKCARRIPR